MKRICLLFFLLLCAVPAALPVHPARAFLGPQNDAATQPAPELIQHDGLVSVIVQLSDEPVATYRGGIETLEATSPADNQRLDFTSPSAQRYESYLQAREQMVLDKLRQDSSSLKVTRHFTRLFNGFAAEVPLEEVGLLRQTPGVKMVTFARRFHLLLNDSTALIKAPALWSRLGSQRTAGRGIKIAIIDTGIDVGGDRLTSPPTPDNPFFNPAGFAYPPGFPLGNTAFTTPKVIVARVYLDPSDLPAKNVPYASTPRDEQGHGSHVGGIAAGVITKASNRIFPLLPPGTLISGVAPGAYLMNYKIFFSRSSGLSGATTAQILAALQDAVSDGADVVNMSLGGPAEPLRVDPMAQAVEAAVKAGVTMVIAAGNDGPGPETVSTPATASHALAVAASGNAHFFGLPFFTIGSQTPFAHGTAAGLGTGSAQVNSFGPTVIVPVETLPGYSDIRGCTPEPPGSLTGKIALVERGQCLFLTKGENAKKAGAAGIVIWDNHPEALFVPLGVNGFPTLALSQAEGKTLDAYITAHPGTKVQALPTARDFPIAEQFVNEVAFFSSRGVNVNFGIKPDLAAPGQDIYSAAEANNPAGEIYNPSGSTVLQGTSMAAPHVAGAAALVLAAHPAWTPGQVKSALMATANQSLVNNEIGGRPATIEEEGAGLVDLSRAASPGLTFDQPSISFGSMNAAGSGESLRKTITVTAQDVSGRGGTWTLTISPTGSLPKGVTITAPSAVTVGAGARATFSIEAALSQAASGGTVEGNILLSHAGTTLHVPFLLRVTTVPIPQGSVLLLDGNSTEKTATLINQSYLEMLHKLPSHPTVAVWNIRENDAPSVADLRRAGVVILETGLSHSDFANQALAPTVQNALTEWMTTTTGPALHGPRLLVSSANIMTQTAPDFTLNILLGLGVQDDFYNQLNKMVIPRRSVGGEQKRDAWGYPNPGAGILNDLNDGVTGKRCSDTDCDGLPDAFAIDNFVDVGTLLRYARAKTWPEKVPWHLRMILGDASKQTIGVVHLPRPAELGSAGDSDPDLDIQGIGASPSPWTPSPTSASPDTRLVYLSYPLESVNDNAAGGTSREKTLEQLYNWLTDTVTVTTSSSFVSSAANKAVSFTGSATASPFIDPRNKETNMIKGYRWNFGDGSYVPFGWLNGSPRTTATGTYSTNATVQHTYSRPGTYIAQLEAYDSLGHTALSRQVKVTIF